MPFLLGGTLVLVGFVFGYFFQAPVLVIFTSVCLVIAINMTVTYKEMGSIITMIFIACAVAANIAMWVTYYMVTDQSLLQTFFKTYILR